MASERTMQDYFDIFYELQCDVVGFFAQHPKGKQPWTVLSRKDVARLWKEFARTGQVKEKKTIDLMASQVIRNIAKLEINTELLGHSTIDPAEIFESCGLKLTKKLDNAMSNYFVDDDGGWRISDFALDPLRELACDLLEATTPEEKLLLIDRVFNTVHRRSNLAASFVEGGGDFLRELSSEDFVAAKGYDGGFFWKDQDD